MEVGERAFPSGRRTQQIAGNRQRRGVMPANAGARHPGVDLEMKRQVGRRDPGRERLDVTDHRPRRHLGDVLEEGRDERTEHDNRSGSAPVDVEFARLITRRDSEPTVL